MTQWAWRYPHAPMSHRLPCPPAPGPLEAYATQFDDLFGSLAQRRGFRAYLQGLLLPRDRNKTLTALVGAEPVAGAQHREVQRLQFFLSESPWDQEAVNARRLDGLQRDPTTRAHAEGALVIDETGDHKDGTHTAHVGRQYLGAIGKTDNGIVAVSSLWADAGISYPLHVQPYTPAPRLPKGKADPAFRTKPAIAVALVAAAVAAGIAFRAVVADCLYGDNPTFEGHLEQAQLPFVLSVKPSTGIWAPADAVHNPKEAVADLPWRGPAEPGAWTPVVRHFRDGHTETWWAVDLRYGPYGPESPRRMVVATTDPATLPDLTTWYLTTNLPHPTRRALPDGAFAPADLAEVVRLSALRNWVEQSYRQVKQELGWADFMVRTDRAIRRHWHLVGCAFTFCWHHWFATARASAASRTTKPPAPANSDPARAAARPAAAGRGENGARPPARVGGGGRRAPALLAQGAAPGPRLAAALERTAALVAGVVGAAAAPRAADPPGLADHWPPAEPLSP